MGPVLAATYDWSTVDLSPITDQLTAILPVVVPIMIAVIAVTVGVKLFKKFAKGVG